MTTVETVTFQVFGVLGTLHSMYEIGRRIHRVLRPPEELVKFDKKAALKLDFIYKQMHRYNDQLKHAGDPNMPAMMLDMWNWQNKEDSDGHKVWYWPPQGRHQLKGIHGIARRIYALLSEAAGGGISSPRAMEEGRVDADEDSGSSEYEFIDSIAQVPKGAAVESSTPEGSIGSNASRSSDSG